MENLIFYQTVTQYENTGDLIINKSLVNLFEGYGKLIANDRNVPDWYLDDIGISKSERLGDKTNLNFGLYLIKEVFRNALKKNSQVYLVSGPGHFYGNSAKKTLKNIISGFLYFFLKIGGCRIVKCGVSLGPLSPLLGFSESFRSWSMHKYFLRDSLSLDLSRKFWFKNIEYLPDLAWPFSIEESGNKKQARKNAVLLSFRSSVIEKNESTNKYFEDLLLCLQDLLDIVMQADDVSKIIVSYQVERDRDTSLKIFNELRGSYDIQFIDDQVSLETASDVYGQARYVFSNRLHVLLLASKFGALPIALTDIDKHLKIKGIFEDASLSELLLDIYSEREIQEESILNLIQNRNQVFSKIRKKENEYTLQTQQLIQNIFN